MSKINIGGIFVERVDIKEACSIAKKYVIANKDKKYMAKMLQAVNTDSIVKAHVNEEMNKISNKADLAMADGMPLIWVSKFLGKPLKERIAGPDFFEYFNVIANDNGYSYYFLGSTEEVLCKLIKCINAKYPNIKVLGFHCPPFSEMNDYNENIAICERINLLKPDAVWVSFGCPKQEIWIANNKDNINSGIIMGIGAAFDFYAGVIKRAPLFIQKIGFEWLYRLLREPRRLYKRYLIDGLKFFKYVVTYKNITL